MVAPPKRRAPHKAIHYRTRDKGQFRNGSKSGGPEGGDIQDEKESSPENINTTKHNQQLLDIFRNTYYELLTSSDFAPKLQAVKQALFERDFAKAFGDPENLEIYAARWSPTRALCYASVFAGIKDKLEKILTPLPPTTSQQSSAPSEDKSERTSSSPSQNPEEPSKPEESTTTHYQGIKDKLEKILTSLPSTTSQQSSAPSEDKSERTPSSPSENPEEPSKPEESTRTQHHHHHLQVLSIGGCAAELIAFGSLLSAFPPSISGSLTLLDSGPWKDVIASLTTTITTPPPVSKYASAAAKARGPGTALIHPPSRLLSSTFLKKDVLALGPEGLSPIIAGGGGGDDNNNKPTLITLLFTLNELFTASGIGKTTKFLLDLTSVTPFGSLLLVVDSPGSYSETTIGREESKKKYPMQWLLDRIILGTQKEPVAGRRWKKLESHDSIWFRLDQREKKLDYPIALENMRYQMHLYRVVDASLPEEDNDDE